MPAPHTDVVPVQVGNAKFTQQHDAIQRLNLQVRAVILCISAIFTCSFVRAVLCMEGAYAACEGTPMLHACALSNYRSKPCHVKAVSDQSPATALEPTAVVLHCMHATLCDNLEVITAASRCVVHLHLDASLTSQAHWNAQQHSDEFVMDLLVSLDKLSMLVQELLVIEVGAAAQPMLAAQQRTAASTSVTTLLQTISAC